MSKTILTTLTLFLFSTSAFAQESIGFPDSPDFQFLMDYRLPDWGYSTFSLAASSFELRGDNEHTNYPTNINIADTDLHIVRGNFTLSPDYRYFRESEKRTINLGFNGNLGANFYNWENEPEDSEEEKLKRKSTTGDINVFATINQYVTPNVFFITGIDAQFEANKDTEDYEEFNFDNELEDYFRTFSLTPEIGIGFGRIRNVTPVLRAIRLKERYTALGNRTLSNREILNAAGQFTKYQGYTNRYDRSNKYFWSDMNKQISGKLDGISPYDMFYLQDVLLENLGSRFEGSEVYLTGNFIYSDYLRKQEQNGEQVQKTSFITKSAEIKTGLDWYKNLSLNHQLSTNLSAEVQIPFESDAIYNSIYSTRANFGWLWNVADRFLLNTYLNGQFSTTNYDTEESNVEKAWGITSQLSTTLTYFIENRLALTTGFNTNYQYSKSEYMLFSDSYSSKNLNWRFMASIKYYFDRKLF